MNNHCNKWHLFSSIGLCWKAASCLRRVLNRALAWESQEFMDQWIGSILNNFKLQSTINILSDCHDKVSVKKGINFRNVNHRLDKGSVWSVLFFFIRALISHVLKSLIDSVNNPMFWYSKELTDWDDSFEYPHHRVQLENREIVWERVINLSLSEALLYAM